MGNLLLDGSAFFAVAGVLLTMVFYAIDSIIRYDLMVKMFNGEQVEFAVKKRSNPIPPVLDEIDPYLIKVATRKLSYAESWLKALSEVCLVIGVMLFLYQRYTITGFVELLLCAIMGAIATFLFNIAVAFVAAFVLNRAAWKAYRKIKKDVPK